MLRDLPTAPLLAIAVHARAMRVTDVGPATSPSPLLFEPLHRDAVRGSCLPMDVMFDSPRLTR